MKMTVLSLEKTEQEKQSSKEDIFVERQLLLVGGADSRLHIYRLRIDNPQETGETSATPMAVLNVLSAYDCTRHLFSAKSATQFSSMV